MIEAGGHDFRVLNEAVEEAQDMYEKPTVIIAHTIKGKGVSFMENKAGWHGRAPTKEEAKIAVAELEKNG